MHVSDRTFVTFSNHLRTIIGGRIVFLLSELLNNKCEHLLNVFFLHCILVIKVLQPQGAAAITVCNSRLYWLVLILMSPNVIVFFSHISLYSYSNLSSKFINLNSLLICEVARLFSAPSSESKVSEQRERFILPADHALLELWPNLSRDAAACAYSLQCPLLQLSAFA